MRNANCSVSTIVSDTIASGHSQNEHVLDETFFSTSNPFCRGDVAEIQGPSGSGKSHLVYHLVSTCVLPPQHQTGHLGGWGRVAIVFDCDGAYDLRRFRELLEFRVASSLRSENFDEQRIGTHAFQQLIDDSLSRLHILRPDSSIQLAASLLHLPELLATKPSLRHAEMALLVVDSVSAFYWPDRLTAEQLRQGGRLYAPGSLNPFTHVVTALEHIRALYAPAIVLTNWALTPAPLPPDGAGGALPPYKQHMYPFLGLQRASDDSEEPEPQTLGGSGPPGSITTTVAPHDDLQPQPLSQIRTLPVQYRVTLDHTVDPQPLSSGSRRSPGGVCLRSELWAESGSRRSPDKVCLQLESGTRPGSRRGPGGVFLQLKSGAKSGSRRSPDEAYQRLKLVTEPGSRRSPGGVCLRSELWAEIGRAHV